MDCAYVYGNQDEVRLLHVPLFIATKQFGTGQCRFEEGYTTWCSAKNSLSRRNFGTTRIICLKWRSNSSLHFPNSAPLYLYLFLIHWPVAFVPGRGMSPTRADKPDQVEIDPETSVVETWKAMFALPSTGRVRAVGVSNFTVQQLETIIKATGERPAMNQIEAHPLLPQNDLMEYCKKEGIHRTAYSPLGNNRE
jgi:hypothetical protein